MNLKEIDELEMNIDNRFKESLVNNKCTKKYLKEYSHDYDSISSEILLEKYKDEIENSDLHEHVKILIIRELISGWRMENNILTDLYVDFCAKLLRFKYISCYRIRDNWIDITSINPILSSRLEYENIHNDDEFDNYFSIKFDETLEDAKKQVIFNFAQAFEFSKTDLEVKLAKEDVFNKNIFSVERLLDPTFSYDFMRNIIPVLEGVYL